MEQLRGRGTRITVEEVETDLWGLRAEPEVGIGQQTMVVRVPEGVLLFDCVGYIDEVAVELVRSLGPTLAVAASHPHMYGVQTEWAHALGGVPVLVAAPDAEWVRRRDPLVELYDEQREIARGTHPAPGRRALPRPGRRRVEAGAEGRGVLLAGDAVFPNPDRRSVSSMRGYPNRIPLSATSSSASPGSSRDCTSTGSTTTSVPSCRRTPRPCCVGRRTATRHGRGGTSTT